jgi:hypothetical protein
MKLRNLFMAVIAGAAALVACEQLEELGLADLSVDQAEISLPAEESSATIGLVATRDWMVSGELPEWITLSATSGEASSKPQTITVTVLENKGNDRETTINFTIGLKKASVLVKQAGAMGEIKKGSGTKDDPYTVAGVIAFVESLGADVQSDKVYVKGVVSEVATTFAASGNYGNATFYIKDSADAEQKFYVFQTYYLGNRQWKSGDTEIKVGDQVIIYGPVVNYKGNTPETAGKGASFIYSLNDKSDGGDEPVNEGTAKGKGTLEEPYNPAGAAAFAKSLGADVQSDKVYIKGKVSKVGTTFEASGTYGNATFNIVDAEDGTGDFYVFQTYYLGNRQWKSGDTEIKVGDIVIIYGPVVNYKGNTPETAGKGASFIYSLNGKTDGGNEEVPQGEAKGDGTLDNPYNPAGAAAVASKLSYTDKDNYQTTDPVYVTGKVSKVSTTFEASGTYGNASFTIVDATDGTGSFEIYQTYYLGNRMWEIGDQEIKVGDVVIVYGPLMNYKGNTPETVGKGASYIYSLNGQTEVAQSPVFGVESADIKVAASATTAEIKVKGNVAWSVARKSDQVTCDPTSGEGAATITVTFPANESTENEVGYSVALSTDADVENKTILVNIIQGKAGQGGEKSVTVETNNTLTWTTVTDDTYKEGRSITVDGVTFTCYKNTSNTGFDNFLQSNHIRIFKNYVLKIDAGTTITKVVLNCAFSDKCFEFTVSNGTKGTADTSVPSVTWEGEIDPFIAEMTGGQNRVGSIEVYYK